jgi:hypothetical protein
MKKKMLFIHFVLFFSTVASAQLLQNTTWLLNNCPQPSITSMKFSLDSVFISGNNISYSPIARYWENGNSFKLYDFAPASTSCYDTGRYTFSISNNILDFVTVSDPCSVREPIFNQSYGSLVLTEITETKENIVYNIYPNPSSSGVFNFVFSNSAFVNQIVVCDILGREVKQINQIQLKENLIDDEISVSISNFPAGLYLARIGLISGKTTTIKIVKN